jgi:small nuclear ribonucleoprotein (snRNP)-like protein
MASPQDFLNQLVGKKVRVYTVNAMSVSGTLKASDSAFVVIADDKGNIQIFSVYSIVYIAGS